MTHSVDPSGIVGNLASAGAAGCGPVKPGTRRKPKGSAEVRLGRGHEAVIQKALHSEVSDPEALQQARDALNARQLDTIEAARKAAEKITRFGI